MAKSNHKRESCKEKLELGQWVTKYFGLYSKTNGKLLQDFKETNMM